MTLHHPPTILLTAALLLALTTPTLAKSAQTTSKPPAKTPSKQPSKSPASTLKPYDTRQALYRAESDFNRIQLRLQRALQKSHDYQFALAELQTAQIQYDQTSRLLTGQLSLNPTYLKAKSIAHQLRQKVNTLRSSGASQHEILTAANAALEANSCLSWLESQIAANFHPLHDAREKFQQATQLVQDIQRQHLKSLTSNPDWQSAHARLESARAAHLAATVAQDRARQAESEKTRRRLPLLASSHD